MGFLPCCLRFCVVFEARQAVLCGWEMARAQIKSLERELETIHLDNEGLKKKQVKLDEQLTEMQHLRSTMMLSPSPHAWELQLLRQQACPVVPREHFL